MRHSREFLREEATGYCGFYARRHAIFVKSSILNILCCTGNFTNIAHSGARNLQFPIASSWNILNECRFIREICSKHFNIVSYGRLCARRGSSAGPSFKRAMHFECRDVHASERSKRGSLFECSKELTFLLCRKKSIHFSHTSKRTAIELLIDYHPRTIDWLGYLLRLIEHRLFCIDLNRA